MLKGETTIELTDVHTGEKEEIKSENMFTNALQNMIDVYSRLRGDAFYPPSTSHIFPLLNNTLGGIMLFDSPLEENADNISPPTSDDAECTACANVYMNNTEDPKRGTINRSESGALDDGYRFVWDFNTSQGNGQIASAALTTKTGGVYGATPNRYATIILGEESDTSAMDKFYYTLGYELLFRNLWKVGPILSVEGEDNSINTSDISFRHVLTFDAENLCFNMAKCEAVNGTLKLFLFDLYINLSALKLKSEPTALQVIKNCRSCEICSSGEAFGDLSRLPIVVTNPTEEFCYLVESVTTKTIAIAKVNMRTLHLEFCKSGSISPFQFDDIQDYSFANPYQLKCVAIQGKYLYITSHNSSQGNNFLKINTDNLSEMKEIVCDYNENYGPSGAKLFGFGWSPIYQGKRMLFSGGSIENDEIYLSPLSGYDRNYFLTGGLIKDVVSYIITVSSDGGGYIRLATVANAMMTVNNLPTPVTKTADKTMKITYIVRDVDESV